jgi:sulfur carrier protein ThiS
MQIAVTLMGLLRSKTPAGGKLQLADGATLTDVFDALDISRDRVLAVSLNGEFERDFERVLQTGDELTVLPPVSGG